jgi:hypothetical protein
MSALHKQDGVSDMEKFAVFSAPAVPYCEKNARWKNSFFSDHGVGSPPNNFIAASNATPATIEFVTFPVGTSFLPCRSRK